MDLIISKVECVSFWQCHGMGLGAAPRQVCVFVSSPFFYFDEKKKIPSIPIRLSSFFLYVVYWLDHLSRVGMEVSEPHTHTGGSYARDSVPV